MTSESTDPNHPVPAGAGHSRSVGIGLALVLLGCLAVAAPMILGKIAVLPLGLLMVAAGVLQALQAFAIADRRRGNSSLLGAAVSVGIGSLLVLSPRLSVAGLAIMLGLSFLIDGITKVGTAIWHRSVGARPETLPDGCINIVLGLAIAAQWPIGGILVMSVYLGVRLLSSGWSTMFGRAVVPAVPADFEAATYPDAKLQLPAHPELTQLQATLIAEEDSRRRVDRYWVVAFLATFFAIHIGRMSATWTAVGLLSPAVAVVGDIFFALVLAYAVVTPARIAWRAATRRFERHAWRRLLAPTEGGESPGILDKILRHWLTRRWLFSLRVQQARQSPTAALRWGLQVGLPLTAVLIATNPIWGFSWFFNTENWATEVWASWAEHRTDRWREAMAVAVREEFPEVAEANLFAVQPDGVNGTGDFSFLVIGDTGEGDQSQHVLRDVFLRLGERPDVKFLVLSSDVIYPAGEMKDYEANFYLPFKGWSKPIYAVPGNHDWYDALEGFNANILDARSARAALRARRTTDHNLTSTTEGKIEELIAEAARLRELYHVRTGGQRAPYFEVQTDGFALIVVDTGIVRTMDPEQERWLRAALARSEGKFKLAVLGHPLYAAGHYQGQDDPSFAALHKLLREHEVEVAMAGDTHDFEFYRENYESRGRQRSMLHFVNGGGGAYLSIGTALDWPKQAPVADCAYYPGTTAITRKLDRETPLWKRPLWFWVHRLGAWPASPEGMAGAFNFNQAPFFQSFIEVKVERSTNLVRLVLHGVDGPLRWRDLDRHGQVIPEGQDDNAIVEFTLPLRVAK